MSHLQYFDYPGWGARVRKEVNYAQAVRIDNRIEISGQGGWNRTTEALPSDFNAEIDSAFDNVEHTLQQAGGTGFDQVYKLRVYLVGYDVAVSRVVENVKGRFPRHSPLLTVVGVERLHGEMRVEIEAEAHIEL